MTSPDPVQPDQQKPVEERAGGMLTLTLEPPAPFADTTTVHADVDGTRMFTVTVHDRGLRPEHATKAARLVYRLLDEIISGRLGQPQDPSFEHSTIRPD